MRRLLIVTAVIEAGVGLALLLTPALPVSVLLGRPPDTPAGLIVARVAGAALGALGLVCWQARRAHQRPAATGVVAAMLFYNVAVVVVLAYARFGAAMNGVGVWPAVVRHAALAG
jgi:hypothetical protein